MHDSVKQWQVGFRKEAFVRLEPYAMKVARTVLRGEQSREALFLPDPITPVLGELYGTAHSALSIGDAHATYSGSIQRRQRR